MSLTGAPKLILDAFETLNGSYDILTVATNGGPFAGRFRQLGRVILIPPRISGDSKVRRGLRTIIRVAISPLQLILWWWRPDVIYVNSTAALPIVTQLKLPKAPIILHVHELLTSIQIETRGCGDLLAQWPNRYIAVSQAVVCVLVDTFGVDPEKIALVHGFVPDSYGDLAAAAPSTAKTTPPSAIRPLVIGGAGRPHWRKGPLLWLQMAQELIAILGPGNVRFIWVGVGDDIEGLTFTEMRRKLGLEDQVELVPVTSEPLAHFAKFDLFAMTSWEDPFPLVVLENMILGNPVVCFAGGGGAGEAVGTTGVIVPKFSPRAMAEAIAELSKSPERLAALGQAARCRALEHFTASSQAEKIRTEIERIR